LKILQLKANFILNNDDENVKVVSRNFSENENYLHIQNSIKKLLHSFYQKKMRELILLRLYIGIPFVCLPCCF